MRERVETGWVNNRKTFLLPKEMENISRNHKELRNPAWKRKYISFEFFSCYVWWLHMKDSKAHDPLDS